MLSAASTEARQLEFFVENRLGGTDNAFQVAQTSTASRKSDGFWEIAPRVVLRDDQDELSYDFRYQPTYQEYFKTPKVDGWDHNAIGRFDWSVTPKDSVGVSGSFVSNRRLREEFIDNGVNPDPTLQASDRQRVNRGRSRAYYFHYFTQVLSARAEYSFDDLDYNISSISDSTSHTGSAGLNYALNPLTSIGATVSTRFRNSRVNQPTAAGLPPIETRNATRTIDISFSLQRQLTKTIDFSVQAGPSFLNTEQDQQIPFLPATQKSYSNDQSVFAAVSVNKRWRKGNMTAAYSRYESGGGQSVSSSIVDDVSLQASYRYDQRWSIRAYAGWNKRKDVTNELFGANDLELTVIRFVATLTRKILPRLDVVARINYRIQTQVRSGIDPETETLTGWLGLQYNFDPIVF